MHRGLFLLPLCGKIASPKKEQYFFYGVNTAAAIQAAVLIMTQQYCEEINDAGNAILRAFIKPLFSLR